MWDFVKNAIVEDINAVPEQFRGFYVKAEDNKFKISDTAKPLVDMYTGVNTSYEKAKKDLATANNESATRRQAITGVVEFARKLGLEGIDEANPIAVLDTHITELMGKIRGGKDLNINLDSIKKDYETKNKSIADSFDARDKKKDAALNKHMIGSAINAAMAKHAGNPKLLTDIVSSRAKVVQEGDDYVVRVLDDAGSPRSNGAGGWLDIDGLVGEMKTDTGFAGAFASQQKSGNDHKSNMSNQQKQKTQQGEKTSTEKIAAGLSKRMPGQRAA